MIALRVDAVSGHYRVPGQVGQGAVAATFPIAPLSTVRGFIESLCGEGFQTFQGRLAYGWLRHPEVMGRMYRTAHVWASPVFFGVFRCATCGAKCRMRLPKKKLEEKDHPVCHGPTVLEGKVAPKGDEGTRTIHVETMFDLSYAVLVDDPVWEAKIRKALAGEVERYGTLYLGESSDQVCWLDEVSLADLSYVQWVVPGDAFSLPVRAGRGYHDLGAVYAKFDLKQGEPSWHAF